MAWYNTRLAFMMSALVMVPPLGSDGRTGEGKVNLVNNPRFSEKDGVGRPKDWIETSGGVFRAIEQHSIVHPTALLYNGTLGTMKPQCVQFASTNPCWCYQKIPAEPGKRYRVSARYWGSNGSSPSVAVQWTKCATWNGGSYPSHSHDPDVEGWQILSQEFVLPLDIDNDGITIALYNGYVTPANGTAMFDNVEVVEVHHEPVRSVLMIPPYRGRILDKWSPVQVRVYIRDPIPVLELRLKRNGTILYSKSTEKPKQNATIDFKFSYDFVDVGCYELEVRVLSLNQSDVIYQESHNLTRVQDGTPPPKVDVNVNHTLTIYEEPFFPIGLYFSVFQMNHSMLQLVSDSAFNTVLPYDNMQNLSLTLNALDVAHENAVNVIVPAYDWNDFENAKKRINTIKAHPATMAWYTSDEKGLNWVPQLRELYEYIVSVDHDHPTYSVFTAGQVADISDYLEVCDILGTDPYPIGDGAGINASMVGDWGRYTVQGTFGANPVWQVIQGFSHNNSLIPMWPKTGTFRTPTLEEMRSMTWQSICAGANGVMLYSFFEFMRESDHVTFEQQWSRAKIVAQEVSTYSRILLSGNREASFSPRINTTAYICTRAQWFGSKYWIFAVNNGNGNGITSFHLDQHISLVDVMKAGSNTSVARSINPNSTYFTDTVPPLSVVVYRLATNMTDSIRN